MVTKEQLDEYLRAYHEGHPLITDEEYDRLLEEYLQNNGGEKARPFNRQRQSDDVNDIVGTLPKLYGVQTPMREGLPIYKDWVRTHKLIDQHVIVQPKLDGCSVAVDFTTGRFFTRGDYDDGESVDVTELFEERLPLLRENLLKKPWNGLYAKTTAMKFEVILSHERFIESGLSKQHGGKYTRPRDAVSGTLTSRNKDVAKLLTLIPLRGYMNRQQYIPYPLYDMSEHIRFDDFTTIEEFIKKKLDDDATVQFDDMTFSIDGVVVSVIDPAFHAAVNPMHEAAIKILFNMERTKLKAVEYQIGKQGRFTPVAILDPPAKFGDVNVDHVTLSTLERVTTLGLKHNDTVSVMYNIVPYLIDSDHDGDYPIPVPTKCPVCGMDLDYVSLKLVRCSNPNCKALRLGSIIRHAEKMKMVGLSKGIITKLYDEGFVKCIEDLYHLKDFNVQNGIRELDGFGDKSVENMLRSIDEALHSATLERFLGSLPFNDTADKTWRIILNHVDNQALINSMCTGEFEQFMMSIGYIPGVGNMKIQRLIYGYMRNIDEIRSLMQWVPSQLAVPKQRLVPVHGKCAMTGTRDADATRELERIGYEVGSFTRDCKFLIIPHEGFTSAKTEKAKEWNIPIYTLDHFNDWLSNKSGQYPF